MAGHERGRWWDVRRYFDGPESLLMPVVVAVVLPAIEVARLRQHDFWSGLIFGAVLVPWSLLVLRVYKNAPDQKDRSVTAQKARVLRGFAPFGMVAGAALILTGLVVASIR